MINLIFCTNILNDHSNGLSFYTYELIQLFNTDPSWFIYILEKVYSYDNNQFLYYYHNFFLKNIFYCCYDNTHAFLTYNPPHTTVNEYDPILFHSNFIINLDKLFLSTANKKNLNIDSFYIKDLLIKYLDYNLSYNFDDSSIFNCNSCKSFSNKLIEKYHRYKYIQSQNSLIDYKLNSNTYNANQYVFLLGLIYVL